MSTSAPVGETRVQTVESDDAEPTCHRKEGADAQASGVAEQEVSGDEAGQPQHEDRCRQVRVMSPDAVDDGEQAHGDGDHQKRRLSGRAGEEA